MGGIGDGLDQVGVEKTQQGIKYGIVLDEDDPYPDSHKQGNKYLLGNQRHKNG